MTDSPKKTSLTRRAFIGFSGLLAFLLPALFARNTARADDDALIVVNGWIVKKSDVTGARR